MSWNLIKLNSHLFKCTFVDIFPQNFLFSWKHSYEGNVSRLTNSLWTACPVWKLVDFFYFEFMLRCFYFHVYSFSCRLCLNEKYFNCKIVTEEWENSLVIDDYLGKKNQKTRISRCVIFVGYFTLWLLLLIVIRIFYLFSTWN